MAALSSLDLYKKGFSDPKVKTENMGTSSNHGSDSSSTLDDAAVRDGPPYTWGQLAAKPLVVGIGVAMVTCFALTIAVLCIAANTASQCVWINGVCFDRPGGGYVTL